jgi:hypothetical protein
VSNLDLGLAKKLKLKSVELELLADVFNGVPAARLIG